MVINSEMPETGTMSIPELLTIRTPEEAVKRLDTVVRMLVRDYLHPRFGYDTPNGIQQSELASVMNTNGSQMGEFIELGADPESEIFREGYKSIQDMLYRGSEEVTSAEPGTVRAITVSLLYDFVNTADDLVKSFDGESDRSLTYQEFLTMKLTP
jgi:hypothetical protein